MLVYASACGAVVEVECPRDVWISLRSRLAAICRLDDFALAENEGSRFDPDVRFEIRPVSQGRPGRLIRDERIVFEVDDPFEFERRALSELHLAVAVHARDGVFIHAGAVAWRNVGIVIPGRSMSGKTTLVAALLDQGATYLSDEYAVLDGVGRVHPYPKPMVVRSADGSSRFVAVDDPRTDPVPVRVIASTRYAAGNSWDPELITGAGVVLPLVENAVVARLAPERVLEACAAVGRQAVCWSGPRSEASVTAAMILARLDLLIDDEVVV